MRECLLKDLKIDIRTLDIEYVIMGREYRFSKWIMILDDMQYL